MAVTETSLTAFENKKPELSGDRLRVYNKIEKLGPITGDRVARSLGKPYHCISGRIKELREKDLIRRCGKSENQFGNTAYEYEVVE